MHALFYSNSNNYLADVQDLFVGRPQTLTPFIPMNYTPEQLAMIRRELKSVSAELTALSWDLVSRVAQSLKVDRSKEYLNHGVCRRLYIISRCIENIFSIFPPDRKELLTKDERNDVEINLHAFVIHVYGLQDNLAWLYVYEKRLESKIKGGRRGVGLFNPKTQLHLPKEVHTYLTEERIKSWHDRYAKNYRDALAHRIPLYIPPFTIAPADRAKYEELERQTWEHLKRGELEKHKAAQAEQTRLCHISDLFLHSFADDDRSPPMRLHPQVISDAMTIIEITKVVRKYLC